jgi:hypothetical protein
MLADRIPLPHEMLIPASNCLLQVGGHPGLSCPRDSRTSGHGGNRQIIIGLNSALINISAAPGRLCDFIIRDGARELYVSKRPFLDQFLAELSQLADVYVCTTLTPHLTQQTVTFLDPLGTIFRGILFGPRGPVARGTILIDVEVMTEDPSVIVVELSPFLGDIRDSELIQVTLDIWRLWKQV